MRRGGLLGLALLVLGGSPGGAANIPTAPVTWRVQANDTRGEVVDAERLRGHVTLVTLSTRDTRARAMRLGQEVGGRFGGRPGFQTLTLVNTSQLSALLRPLARGQIADAEQEAVDAALARQRAGGNSTVTEDQVRKRVLFVHDADGRLWRALGVPPKDDALHVGVIDREARLVHLAREPIDEAELLAVLETELSRRRVQGEMPFDVVRSTR
jgi:hypothetical protein